MQGVAQWGGRSSQRTCGAQSKHRVASTLVMTSTRVDFKEAEYSPLDERCQIRHKIVVRKGVAEELRTDGSSVEGRIAGLMLHSRDWTLKTVQMRVSH